MTIFSPSPYVQHILVCDDSAFVVVRTDDVHPSSRKRAAALCVLNNYSEFDVIGLKLLLTAKAVAIFFSTFLRYPD